MVIIFQLCASLHSDSEAGVMSNFAEERDLDPVPLAQETPSRATTSSDSGKYSPLTP